MKRINYETVWVQRIIHAVNLHRRHGRSVGSVAGYDLRNYRGSVRGRLERIRIFKKKLTNPINQRTGKPLAAATIRAYQRELSDMKKFMVSDRSEIVFWAGLGFYGPPSKRLQRKASPLLKMVMQKDPETFFYLKNLAAEKMRAKKTGAKVIHVDFHRQQKAAAAIL